MKRRLSAILLAMGLSVSVLSMGVYAAETETEQVTETVAAEQSEAAAETEAAAVETEAAQTETAAAQTEAAETEAAASETEMAQTETAETMSPEEMAKDALSSVLAQVSAWSEEELEAYMNSEDPSSARIASNWSAVRGELGNFVEVTSAEMAQEGYKATITGTVSYDKAAESTEIFVTYTIDQAAGTVNIEWDVKESMATKMKKAGLNTLMGVGIVFLTLLFLSLLIGQLHRIPDMIEARAKKNAPAPAPAPVPAPAAAPVVEEDLTDDLELVAVITAAIAASENTSSDGFVVRSIKKTNKRNWQRA